MNYSNMQLDHVERMKLDGIRNSDYYIEIMHKRYPVYIELIKKYKKNGKILDIGCGFANIWYSQYVKPNGYCYCCTDMSNEVVDYMTALIDRSGGESTQIGSLEALPWETGFFDIVFASHILEHCLNINIALNEIRRVLKNDGILFFAVPCGYDDEPAHTHNREMNEWKQDFKDNGWLLMDCGQFDFNQNEFYGTAAPTNIND